MSSWTYADCCLIVNDWSYASGEPPLVRSYGAKSGLKLPFSSANDGSVGSVMPNVNRSCSCVAPIVPPNFTLWLPAVIVKSALTPMFCSVRS